jgi:hypothetical protein
MKYIQALGLLLASSLIISNVEATIPKCTDCTVFTTGKDGSLWGWENDSFCRIPKKCYKTKTTKTTKKTTSKKITSTVISKATSKAAATKATSSKVATTKADATKAAEAKVTASSTVQAAPVNTSGPHQTNEAGNMICNGCTVTGTGSDEEKSLWGWEDEKSCVIDKEKCKGQIEDASASQTPNETALANHKKDAKGNLICNQCNITATGGDKQSFWGWEDEASCIIDNVKCGLSKPEENKVAGAGQRGADGILICSSCDVAETHADTTLWNTENGEPCRVIGSRCNINSTLHGWCSGCVVTATGGDGALYGWENLQSCLINEQACGFCDKLGNPIGADVQDEEAGALSQKVGVAGMTVASLVALFLANAF